MAQIFTISKVGEELIQHYESCRLKPYLDSKGIVTIGWGHPLHDTNGEYLKSLILVPPQFLNITQAFADQLFLEDMEIFEEGVAKIDTNRNAGLHSPIFFSQNQFDALCDFSFNEGLGALRGSTLLKRIIENSTDEQITNAFLMWNMADGEENKGLRYRRQSDAVLYTEGRLQFFN